MPITVGTDDQPLGEADIMGAIGSFTLTGDPENPILTWTDDTRPDQVVEFHKM